MRRVLILILLCLSFSSAGVVQQNSHLAFVSEYVRQLGANEKYRELAYNEFQEKGSNQLLASIRGPTRIVLELSTQIAMLRDMRLKKPFDELPNTISQFYGQKVELYNSQIAISQALVAGPKPGVDYGSMTAELPKITAKMEYIDETLFKATPLVFATLIDEKPDKNGHMSRLIITRAERDTLVQTLNRSFGKKLDQENQNWTVSSASVLRHYLLKKGYKCSDES